jgi:hypothetical protein
VENPHAGNLAWIRDCEVQLRQCAVDVGGSFSAEAVPLCDGMSAHTLNQAADEDDPCDDEPAAGHDLETKAFS